MNVVRPGSASVDPLDAAEAQEVGDERHGAMEEEQQRPDPADRRAPEQAAAERHHQDQHPDE